MKNLSVPSNHWFAKEFFLVILCAIILTLPWIERAFHTRGEPREALVAQAMLDTGDWISPAAYDGAVPSKPPFMHWLIAMLSLPGGEVTEATCRLPSALAFVAFSAFFFQFLARRTSRVEACTASLILLSCFEWFRSGVTCRVDTLLSVSIAGSLLVLFSWWERRYQGVPWLAIILTSCATLTKGPVGLVLPLGIFTLFTLLRDGLSIKQAWHAIGRLLLIATPTVGIASVWYLLGYQQRGEAFLEKVIYENFSRFTSTMADKPHQHSAGYLFGMLSLGMLPWSIPLASKCRSVGLQYRSIPRHMQTWWKNMDALRQYALICVVFIVLFFCIPSSKRSVYLLPAYPFIAFLTSHILSSPDKICTLVFTALKRFILIVVLVACLVVLGSEYYSIAGYSVRFKDLFETMSVTKVGLCGVIVSLWYVKYRYVQTFQTPVITVALSMIGAVVLASFTVYDTAARVMSPRNWYQASEMQPLVESNANRTWYSYGIEMYGASFYLHRPFHRLEKKAAVVGDIIVTQRRYQNRLQAEFPYRLTEIFSYHSGIEKRKKDTVVFEIVEDQLS